MCYIHTIKCYKYDKERKERRTTGTLNNVGELYRHKDERKKADTKDDIEE